MSDNQPKQADNVKELSKDLNSEAKDAVKPDVEADVMSDQAGIAAPEKDAQTAEKNR